MVGENFNNKCDSCRTELTNIFFSYSGGYLFSENHNFFQAFLTTKGKKQEDNDKFQFCDKCEKEFKSYLIKEAIQELKTKNIANSALLTHRWSSGDFTKEDWQKYQNAVVENIKHYDREWKIKEVNGKNPVRQITKCRLCQGK